VIRQVLQDHVAADRLLLPRRTEWTSLSLIIVDNGTFAPQGRPKARITPPLEAEGSA